ncbi:hypothetical protein CEP53_012986 [Fusarium sp. AF-6]|nr:hypothetical protein CEP53_012986 [Fusarium sp. AF-6]
MHSLSHLRFTNATRQTPPTEAEKEQRERKKKRGYCSVMINAEREGPYLKRTSFLAGVAGLGLADDDDDANSSGRRS